MPIGLAFIVIFFASSFTSLETPSLSPFPFFSFIFHILQPTSASAHIQQFVND